MSIQPNSKPPASDYFARGIAKARQAWKQYELNRDFDQSAVYGYLTAVYLVVRKWQNLGRANKYSLRALKQQKQPIRMKADPYARLIYCTSNVNKVDAKTRSKWARVMHYVARHKKKDEPLGEFVRRNGGLNKCAEDATWDRA
jgi:hypothetical protein